MLNSSNKNPVAVIGIGNFFRKDDGAGIHAVDLLRSYYTGTGTDIIDGATAGAGLRFYIENRRKVIFIDAGSFGGKPGEYIRFLPAEVRTRKQLSGLSFHDFDLMAFLQNPPQGLELPEEIIIYCIEPGCMDPGDEISPVVKSGLEKLVQEVLDEISQI